MQDQRLLREVSAGRGGKATIYFKDYPARDSAKYEAEYVVLTNGGVMHTDGDGHVRWHAPRNLTMVVWEGEDG